MSDASDEALGDENVHAEPGCWRCSLSYEKFPKNDVYCPQCGAQN